MKLIRGFYGAVYMFCKNILNENHPLIHTFFSTSALYIILFQLTVNFYNIIIIADKNYVMNLKLTFFASIFILVVNYYFVKKEEKSISSSNTVLRLHKLIALIIYLSVSLLWILLGVSQID